MLRCARNRLSALPPSLGRCPRLEELDARSNALRDLPGELGQATSLRVLNLEDNPELKSIPGAVFSGCIELHSLSVKGTAVTHDGLERTPGFEAFEGRLRARQARAVAGDVLLGAGATDLGVAHQLAVPHI